MRENKSVLAIALLLATTSMLFSQVGSDYLQEQFPAEPVVYLEFDHLADNLSQLLASEFAEKFAESPAFEDFKISKLALKLLDRLSNLQENTGFALSLENFKKLSGDNSAFAVYDIGELKLLFATRLSMPKLAATTLWDLRKEFEKRSTEADKEYFIKTDAKGDVVLAFAFLDGYLWLGTDLATFEAVVDKDSADSLINQKQFKEATNRFAKAETVRLYLDFAKIQTTPYMRSYWLFANRKELEDISYVASGYSFSKKRIEENRRIWRKERNINHDFSLLNQYFLPAEAPFLELDSTTWNKIDSLMQLLLPKSEGEEWQTLLSSIDAAKPEYYGLALTPGKAQIGSTTAATLIIKLNAGDKFSADQFESSLSKIYSSAVLGEATEHFEFIETQVGRSLMLPHLSLMTTSYWVSNDAIYISVSETDSSLSPAIATPIPDKPLTAMRRINFKQGSSFLQKFLPLLMAGQNSDDASEKFWANAVVSLLKSLNRLTGIEEESHAGLDGTLSQKISYIFW